jgi:hypothetical protein
MDSIIAKTELESKRNRNIHRSDKEFLIKLKASKMKRVQILGIKETCRLIAVVEDRF